MIGTPDQVPDIQYATGFWAPDPVIVLARGVRRELLVSELEQGRAQRVAEKTRGLTVWTPAALNLKGKRRRSLAGWAIALLKACNVKRVTVPPVFPHAVAVALQQAHIRVDISRDALFPARQVKNSEEIAKIKECQEAAVAAMKAAIILIKSAKIEQNESLKVNGKHLYAEQVQEEIHRVLLARQCLCRDVIVAGGQQGTDPHERGHGPLRANESIVIDIFPQHRSHGYWGDLTRTIVRGWAPQQLKEMYHAVRAAQAAALRKCAPRVALRTVHQAVTDEFDHRGFKTEVRDGRPQGFIHSTGHGIGLAIHESPSVAPVPGRLRAGNAITVEPGLYYDGIGGVRIEDTVIITKTGYRRLVPLQVPFEI